MEKVKRLVEAGASIPTAIRESLGMPVRDFADKHALPRNAVSNAINGNIRATDSIVGALVAEIGGTEAEWRELLWLAAKPAERASA